LSGAQFSSFPPATRTSHKCSRALRLFFSACLPGSKSFSAAAPGFPPQEFFSVGRWSGRVFPLRGGPRTAPYVETDRPRPVCAASPARPPRTRPPAVLLRRPSRRHGPDATPLSTVLSSGPSWPSPRLGYPAAAEWNSPNGALKHLCVPFAGVRFSRASSERSPALPLAHSVHRSRRAHTAINVAFDSDHYGV
jgi:hypothetical protein